MPDISLITPTVARRNGLDFFEIVFTDWGDDGAEFRQLTIPSNISLAGASIGPRSTVSEVIIEGTPDSLIGVRRPKIKNDIFDAVVSVEHPYEGLIPGPITIRASEATVWSRALIGEDTNVAEDIATVALPTLQLFGWLRAGASRSPTKRFPMSRRSRFNDSQIPTGGVLSALAMWPILGRNRVELDLWCLPLGAGTGVVEVAVDLCRSQNDSNNDSEFLQRVYPPVPPTQASVGTALRAGTTRNYAHVTIEDPMALFLLVRARRIADGFVLAISMRAVD